MPTSTEEKRWQANLGKISKDSTSLSKYLRGSKTSTPAEAPHEIPDTDMGGGDGGGVPRAAAAASSGGTTSGKAHQETPVDPFINAKRLPYPDTQNAVLPYCKFGTFDFAEGDDAQVVLSIRLNSLHDLITTTTVGSYTADPIPNPDALPLTGTVANPVDETPFMFVYWASIYEYYHVVGCRYQLELKAVNTSDNQLSIWQYHHGIQEPPSINTGLTTVVPDYIRALHPGAKCTQLSFRGSEGGKRFFERSTVTCSGVYAPGPKYVHNTIAEDDQVQTWIKMGQVNPLREKATFIINHSDWGRELTPAACTVRWKLNIEYLVQFKDRLVKFTYPVTTTDIPEVTDYPMDTNVAFPSS